MYRQYITISYIFLICISLISCSTSPEHYEMIYNEGFILSEDIIKKSTVETSKQHQYDIVFSPKYSDTPWGKLSFTSHFITHPDPKNKATWIPASTEVTAYANPYDTDIKISFSSHNVAMTNGYPTHTIEFIYLLLHEGATITSSRKGSNVIVTASGSASSKGKVQFTFTIKGDTIIFEDTTTSLHDGISNIYGDIFGYRSDLYVTKTAFFK